MRRPVLSCVLVLVFLLLLNSAAQSYTEEEYLKFPDGQIDIAEAVLLIVKGYRPNLDIQKYLSRIDAIAAEIKSQLKGETGPDKIIAAINDKIYNKLKLTYELHSPFLNDIFDKGKGNCIAGSTLYLALAKRLGLSAYGVFVPRHIFVRYDDGKSVFNIETTAKGAFTTDANYMDKDTPEEGKTHISEASIAKGVYLKNLTPKDVLSGILNWRGVKYRENEKYDLALRDFQSCTVLSPKEPLAHANLAIIYSEIGKYDKALAEIEVAVGLDPELGSPYDARAHLLLKKNDTDGALREIDALIKRKPKMLDAYKTRAYIWLKKKEIDKALADFTKVIELDPGNVRVLRDRAKIYSDRKEYDAAIADLSRAIEAQPEEYFTYVERGIIWNKKKEPDKAIADFNRTLELAPWEISANHYRGWSWIQKKEYDLAIEDFRLAKGKLPFDIPENCYGRGVAYFMKKDYDSAIIQFDDAARNLKDAGLFFYRGRAYLEKNEPEKAKADFEAALSFDPGMKAEIEPYLKRASGKGEIAKQDMGKFNGE